MKLEKALKRRKSTRGSGQDIETYHICVLSFQALGSDFATSPVTALPCLRQHKAHYSEFYFLFFLFAALDVDFLFLAHASLCTPLAPPVIADLFEVVHDLH